MPTSAPARLSSMASRYDPPPIGVDPLTGNVRIEDYPTDHPAYGSDLVLFIGMQLCPLSALALGQALIDASIEARR